MVTPFHDVNTQQGKDRRDFFNLIKVPMKNLLPIIILNGVRMNAFLLKSETRQG